MNKSDDKSQMVTCTHCGSDRPFGKPCPACPHGSPPEHEVARAEHAETRARHSANTVTLDDSLAAGAKRTPWLCIDCCESIPLAENETCCPKCGAEVRTIGKRGITLDFSALFREERAAARAEERRQRRLAVAAKRAAKRAADSGAAPPAPRPRTSRPRRSAAKSPPTDDEGDTVEVTGSLLLTQREVLADAFADLVAGLIQAGQLPPGTTTVGRK